MLFRNSVLLGNFYDINNVSFNEDIYLDKISLCTDFPHYFCVSDFI